MKKGLLLGVVLVLVVSTVGAFAFQNELDGFKGLKWGDPPSEEMEYQRDLGGFASYILPDDKMSIGNAELGGIIYEFYNSQFSGVFLFFEGEKNYNLLETICGERFGSEELEEEIYNLEWKGQESFILLHYNIEIETGCLALYSTVIESDRLEAAKKKEAEKAEGHW